MSTSIKIFKGSKRKPYIEKDAEYGDAEDRIARRLALAARLGDRIKVNDRQFRVVGLHEVEERK